MTCIQRRCLGVFLLYLYECSRVVVVGGVLRLCTLFKKAEVKRGSSSLTL